MRMAGVIAISSSILEEEISRLMGTEGLSDSHIMEKREGNMARAVSQTPMFLSHGVEDQVLKIGVARRCKDALAHALGADLVSWRFAHFLCWVVCCFANACLVVLCFVGTRVRVLAWSNIKIDHLPVARARTHALHALARMQRV
jgi:hypothetical protein